jgi:methionyl-tRNA formyltransferase
MTAKMKVVFAGTPEFAAVALRALLDAGFEVPLVLTQPDRPAGRGMQLQASAVKQVAVAHGIPVLQPLSLRMDAKDPQRASEAQAAHERLLATEYDVMVVAAYGLILPRSTLDIKPCINIHGSILPRWRGAAPIHRAIEAGDAETGVTIMQMDAGLDTGDMLLAERMAISAEDTTGSLHDKLAVLGGRLIVEALEMAACAGLARTPQPQEGVIYAKKIDKAEAAIDWSQAAGVIARRVRAFNPAPGAAAVVKGEAVKIWRAAAHAGPGRADAGTIVSIDDRGIGVACGDGSRLEITELQRAGGKRMSAGDFLRGYPLEAGDRFC